MNKFVGIVMAILVLGTGTAVANNGILFENSSDSFFTTPAEFLAQGQLVKGRTEFERHAPFVPAQDRSGNDPARAGKAGK